MKVENMISDKGNKIANQFIIEDNHSTYFQSYDSIIAKVSDNEDITKPDNIILDSHFWDYSKTTSKYRNKFLNMSTELIKHHIKNGFIKLENLNKKGA